MDLKETIKKIKLKMEIQNKREIDLWNFCP